MHKQFAVIGCQSGHINVFISTLLKKGYTCAGVYEPDNPELAVEIAAKFDVPVVDDPGALLESPTVELVGSSGMNSAKIGVVEKCEQHGKHVMVDKPLITSRAGLNVLKGVVERNRIQVGMLLTERFRPVLQTLKRKIDAGEFGKLINITFRNPHRLNKQQFKPWFFEKEKCGGIINDILIHEFDLLRWLTSKEVESMQTMQVKNILPEHPTFYDVASAQIIMEDHTTAQMYTDWHTPKACWSFGDCRIFVSGTDANAELRLTGDPLMPSKSMMTMYSHEEPLHVVECDDVFPGLVEDFLLRIDGKDSVITQQDVYLSCKTTLEADEQSVKMDNTVGR